MPYKWKIRLSGVFQELKLDGQANKVENAYLRVGRSNKCPYKVRKVDYHRQSEHRHADGLNGVPAIAINWEARAQLIDCSLRFRTVFCTRHADRQNFGA